MFVPIDLTINLLFAEFCVALEIILYGAKLITDTGISFFLFFFFFFFFFVLKLSRLNVLFSIIFFVNYTFQYNIYRK